MSNSDAEISLKSGLNQVGSFLIRYSDNSKGYCIAIRCHDRVMHYRIKKLQIGTYAISHRISFESIPGLVKYYQQQADGLRLRLMYPYISEKPPTAGLSKQANKEWEIDRRHIKLVKKVGTGQFGWVWKGLWNKTVPVAIKMLKPGAMDRSEFLREAATMRELRHDNILQVYAVSTKKDPIYIISEFMVHGSLLEYLRSSDGRQSKLPHLVKLMEQIINGMRYLEEKHYVHRDLAARNVLVGDKLKCKVADFGLARLIETDAYEMHGKAKVPIRWTAPEAALYNRFTTKSDVWSFGIVLYEIITFGLYPYPSMSNAEVLEKVQQGYRMPQPFRCPAPVYGIMLKCWREDPATRLTFEGLQWELEEIW